MKNCDFVSGKICYWGQRWALLRRRVFVGSATALKPHGCAAEAAAGSSVQSHLGSGLACTLPSPGTCGLLTLSCSEQRICDCYLSQSATICSFSVFSVRPSGSSRCECRCRTWELCMCLLRWSSPALFSSTSCCDVRLDSTIPQTCKPEASADLVGPLGKGHSELPILRYSEIPDGGRRPSLVARRS